MGICQRGGFGFGSSLFRIFADPHCCLLVTRLLSSCLGASPMPTVCYYCLLSTVHNLGSLINEIGEDGKMYYEVKIHVEGASLWKISDMYL